MEAETNITEVWLTPEQAAERIGLTEGALRKWRELESGPPYRKLGEAMSSPVRYPEHLLVKWMQSQKLVMPRSEEAA
jgi:hypothetical protein